MLKEIAFSLPDCWQACKKRKREILTAGLLLGLFVFAYQLKKPLSFTAQGLFKGGNPSQSVPFSKALELLGGSESYSTQEDPKSFMRVYPVLEEVVKSLDLQVAVIEETPSSNRWTRCFRTLKTEAAYVWNKPKAASRVSMPPAPLLSKPLIPDSSPHWRCHHVLFLPEVSRVLSIECERDGHFKVFENNLLLGLGSLGVPFVWDGGSFTLEGTHMEGYRCSLHFMPLEPVIKGLEKSLVIKRDKENPALIYIHYTHQDRHLTAAIVNQTMLCFQSFLKNEGSKKISQQLDYLQMRQKKAQEELEAILDSQYAYLQNHLDSGEIITFEKELEFLADNQSRERKNLQKITGDLYGLWGGNRESITNVIAAIKLSHEQNDETLSLEAANALFADYQCQLDQAQLEQGKLEFCLQKLKELDFDPSSLSQLLSDPALTPRFDKIHTLHRQLADAFNWSEKEKKLLREDLSSEKHFLMNHIEHLKEGVLIQENAFKKHLGSVQKTLLYLLAGDYEATEGRLQELSRKAAHFPQKWLVEKKIDINMQLYREMVESITKMIEAKNIGYHLEYLSASPLKMASSPLLPNPPRLMAGFFLGMCVGLFLALLAYLGREIWKGPTASYDHLQALGYTVFGFFSRQGLMKERDWKTVRNTAYYLSSKGPLLLIGSKMGSPFPSVLCSFFAKQGEKVLLIEADPFSNTQQDLFTCQAFEEDFLFSKSFKEKLADLAEQYDRICIVLKEATGSLELAKATFCADATLFCITDERLSDLTTMESETLFLILPQEDLSPFSLFRVRPLLEAVLKKLPLSSSVSPSNSSQEV